MHFRSLDRNVDVFGSKITVLLDATMTHRMYIVLCGDNNIDFLENSPEKVTVK